MATPRLLIIAPSWLGDMVMAQSLLMALKQRHPQPILDVLTPASTQPILAYMPEVDDAITLNLGHGQLALMHRWRFAKRLQRRGYQQAIVLPNSFKSALIPFWANIPLRTGWRGEQRYGLLNDLRILDKARLPQTVHRFVALAHPTNPPTAPTVAQPSLTIDPTYANACGQRFNLSLAKPVLALCPGAEFGPAKQWPAAHYGQLAQTYLAKGWQVWLLGTDKDTAVCHQINADNGQRCADLSGQTTLSEVVNLLALATAVVSNDSGLMHVAAALDRPLVALYGSTDPKFTPPLHTKKRIVRLGLDCSPCFKRTCPLGHLRCLTELAPSRVIAALTELGV